MGNLVKKLSKKGVSLSGIREILQGMVDSDKDKLETAAAKRVRVQAEKRRAKAEKREEKADNIFNLAPEDVQKRIKNKERNVLRKKERTKEELSQSRTNTVVGGGDTKSYERYLDILLDDKSRTRAIKEVDQMFKDEQKLFDDHMQKEGLGYKGTSKDVKARLKSGGLVKKKRSVKKAKGKGTKWESKWGQTDGR